MKLPLRVEQEEERGEVFYRVVDTNRDPIAGSYSDIAFAKDDAEFIVAACNSHASLTDALGILLAEVKTSGPDVRANLWKEIEMAERALQGQDVERKQGMTEARAREIAPRFSFARGYETLELEGAYSPDELEAIAWWMRNKKVET